MKSNFIKYLFCIVTILGHINICLSSHYEDQCTSDYFTSKCNLSDFSSTSSDNISQHIVPSYKYDCIPSKDCLSYECIKDCQNQLLTGGASLVSNPVVDLRNKISEVYAQGQLGTCVSNAISLAMRYAMSESFTPSRLYIHWHARGIENIENNVETNYEKGLYSISDGIKIAHQLGVCSENIWSYNSTNLKLRPSQQAFCDAALNTVLNIKDCLLRFDQIEITLSKGYPVIFAFEVTSNFKSDNVRNEGIITLDMKDSNLEPKAYHAMLIVGYDRRETILNQKYNPSEPEFINIENSYYKKRNNEPKKVVIKNPNYQSKYISNPFFKYFIARNSWGKNWGFEGHVWLPYNYVQKQGIEYWKIEKVGNPYTN